MFLTDRLAEWALAFARSDLPLEVQRRAKLLLLDTVGCALAAVSSDTAQATLRAIARLGGANSCTVIGTRVRTSVVNAVLANGVLMRTLDLNDLYFREANIGHPSDNLAVALSVGELEGSAGRAVLRAIVMAYELYGRIRDLDHAGSAWDHTMASCLAAPAVAGTLMGLDAGRLADALALCAARGPTLAVIRQGEISAAKSAANAWVAADGTLAALLAAEGLAGPRQALEGEHGWGRHLFRGADLEALAAPLEGEFRIMSVSVKAFPSFGTSQGAVAAALEARSLAGSPLPEVEKVEVLLADLPITRRQSRDRLQPSTRESADHSFHFVVAAALLDGELSARQFEGERWLDPTVRSLIERIEVGTDPRLNRYTPGGFPCHLRLKLSGGRIIDVEMPYPPGHPKNLDAAMVEKKFRASTRGLLDDERCAEIMGEIDALESRRSLARLLDLTTPERCEADHAASLHGPKG